MLIIMNAQHRPEELEAIVSRVKKEGCEPYMIRGMFRVTVNVIGDDSKIDPEEFMQQEGVQEVISVMSPFHLAGRDFKKEDTEIRVKNVTFGNGRFVVIAGPCAVESEAQTLRIACAVKRGGASVLRGGAFKPRSSPYAFQGMGLDGLKILRAASDETGLPVVTEALDLNSLELVNEWADMIQIGTRNMQNFQLLKEVGKLHKPVMLKRGMSATIDEWLMAAEYIMACGNTQVLLCERGIRSFDAKYTRNVVDLGAVPVVRNLSHLPVIVDPSHGTGRKESIAPMTLASMAVGGHGVMVDVHDEASKALCDGPQAITPDNFGALVDRLRDMSKPLSVKMT